MSEKVLKVETYEVICPYCDVDDVKFTGETEINAERVRCDDYRCMGCDRYFKVSLIFGVSGAIEVRYFSYVDRS